MTWNFSITCLAFGINVNRVYNWDDVESDTLPIPSAWYVEVFLPFVHGVWIIDAGHKRSAETSATASKEAD
jgi:hypothetical protein